MDFAGSSGASIQPDDVVAGRYQIKRFLGRGSEGVVFEAIHRYTGQRVALKTLAADCPTQGAELRRLRLLREALILGAIRHPGVVAVLDAGELGPSAQNNPYMVLELLEGRTVEGLLTTRQKLTPTQAVGIMLQACDATAAAHRVGVVHRDLKPANMIVVREADGLERVKLFDFGASKRPPSGEDVKLTIPGVVIGTPAYMPPEQLLGEEADERSDVYALGAILFEMLTGRAPYEGTYAAIVLAACDSSKPPSARALEASISPGLDRVISQALSKDPARRQHSASELAHQLRQSIPEAAARLELLAGMPSSAVDSRRRFPRASYMTPVRITFPDGHTVDGRTEDISEGGLLFFTRDSFGLEGNQEGVVATVRFAVPIDGRVTSTRVRIRWVRRSRPDQPDAPHACGLEFLELEPPTALAVQRFVGLMGTPQPPASRRSMVSERAPESRARRPESMTMPETPVSRRR
jgi:serine/threonine protein kinase